MDPFFIIPDKCHCVDFQVLKLQEAPESVPNGELPRHLQLYCDRYLCERVVPGNRVTVVGIYAIRKGSSAPAKVSNFNNVILFFYLRGQNLQKIFKLKTCRR